MLFPGDCAVENQKATFGQYMARKAVVRPDLSGMMKASRKLQAESLATVNA